MVCLSCTATGERVCLAAEGFGNRHCFLENIADKVNYILFQNTNKTFIEFNNFLMNFVLLFFQEHSA